MNRTVNVGVIVITFNAERFLCDCLDSILSQTYQPHQIVVCDDASTDGTSRIIDEYAGKYPDLFVVQKHAKNQGIARNINSGLKLIETDYFSLIAGDDKWHPDKLLNEISRLRNNVEGVYSACSAIDEDGNDLGPFMRKFDGAEGDVLFEMLSHEMAFRSPLLKTEIVKDIGGYHQELKIFEDWDLKIKYVARTKVAYSEFPTVYYRRHGEGISRRSNPLDYYVALRSIYRTNRHLIDRLDEPQRRIVLERRDADLKKYLDKLLFQIGRQSDLRSNLRAISECLSADWMQTALFCGKLAAGRLLRSLGIGK